MAKILDKLYNRVIDGEILELSNAEIQNLGLAKASQLPQLSDAIVLGSIVVEVDDTDIENVIYSAYFDKSVTKAEYDAIGESGLCILMFNTTCLIFPYAKDSDNRFVISGIYDSDGNSMVVRGNMNIAAPIPAAHVDGSIVIDFDSEFAYRLSLDSELRPYGIVKFLSI